MSGGDLHIGNLVASLSIDGLLTQRDGVVKLLREARQLIAQAQQAADAAHLFTREYRRFDWIVDGETRRQGCNSLLTDEGVDGIVKRLDAQCWGKLMHESGLMTFMDSKAKQDFAANVENCETPDLTLENIEASFSTLYAGRDDMFERGVIRCFKALSWSYKTNQPVKFGRRIIKNVCSKWGSNYRAMAELDDLQRVFRIMDGKPEEDHRNGLSGRFEHSVKRALHGPGKHVDEYMEIKWFKNGNGHITFNRPELVDMLNNIIAKQYPGALPPPRS